MLIFCSVLSVHLTSSKSLAGIVGVASEIQKEKKVLTTPLLHAHIYVVFLNDCLWELAFIFFSSVILFGLLVRIVVFLIDINWGYIYIYSSCIPHTRLNYPLGIEPLTSYLYCNRPN